MASSRKILTAGAVGVAAIALIGAGAGATFTDGVNATQTVTAGKMNVQITNGGGGYVSTDGKSVTLPAFGPTGSIFETKNNIITVTNLGLIPVTTAAFQMSETDNGSNESAALLKQVNVCIKSQDPSGTWVEGNGPLAWAVALRPSVVENSVVLQPTQSMTYSVDFYAGQDSNTYMGAGDIAVEPHNGNGLGQIRCGKTNSDGPTTSTRWPAYVTPASLTNDAQGGIVTPTLTFSFTG